MSKFTDINGVYHIAKPTKPDPRVQLSTCGIRVVIAEPCPDTPEHFIALPNCPFHVRTKKYCTTCWPS